MNTAKRFTNFSNEDFTWAWGKEPYTVKANETILLPCYLADHLAKHLINRELGKLGIATDRQTERDKMMSLANGEVIIDATSPEKLEVDMMNDRGASNPQESEPIIEEKVKEITKKIDKRSKEYKKSKDEAEFEG